MSSPIWKHRRGKSRFRAMYTRSDLAGLLNMSKRQVRYLLGQIKALKPRRVGNRDFYFLSDIRELNPELFESIRLKGDLDEEETSMRAGGV